MPTRIGLKSFSLLHTLLVRSEWVYIENEVNSHKEVCLLLVSKGKSCLCMFAYFLSWFCYVVKELRGIVCLMMVRIEAFIIVVLDECCLLPVFCESGRLAAAGPHLLLPPRRGRWWGHLASDA